MWYLRMRNRNSSPKKLDWRVFLLLLSLAVAGAVIPSRFAVNPTPSLKTTLFLLRNSPGAVGKGDYVVFRLGYTDPYVQDRKLVKRVTCDEGENLVVKGRDYWCNGREYLGRAKERTLKGERLKSFTYSGVIPKGFCFVSGDHKDSYDSRYWGFLAKKDVSALAYPLF
jgi:conjugal transfer pilin signal peptidase TrbI